MNRRRRPQGNAVVHSSSHKQVQPAQKRKKKGCGCGQKRIKNNETR